MTIEEAKIILKCNNIIDFFFAQSKGFISEETEEIGNCLDEDGDESWDLQILKNEATKIILDALERKEKSNEI